MRILAITALGVGLLALTFASTSIVRQDRVDTDMRAITARAEQTDAAVGRRFSQIDSTLGDLSAKDLEHEARLAHIVERLNRNDAAAPRQADVATQPRDQVVPTDDDSFRLLGLDAIADSELTENPERIVAGRLPGGALVHIRYDKPLDPPARQIAESILGDSVSFFYGRRAAFRECARSGIGVEAVHPTLQAAIADKNARPDHNHFEIVEQADGYALVSISVVEHDPALTAILEELTRNRQAMSELGYRQQSLPTFPPDG